MCEREGGSKASWRAAIYLFTDVRHILNLLLLKSNAEIEFDKFEIHNSLDIKYENLKGTLFCFISC